jgi:hypothetical protein
MRLAADVLQLLKKKKPEWLAGGGGVATAAGPGNSNRATNGWGEVLPIARVNRLLATSPLV